MIWKSETASTIFWFEIKTLWDQMSWKITDIMCFQLYCEIAAALKPELETRSNPFGDLIHNHRDDSDQGIQIWISMEF